jgi:hypothetical protein
MEINRKKQEAFDFKKKSITHCFYLVPEAGIKTAQSRNPGNFETKTHERREVK